MKILCATDFSGPGQAAVDLAVTVARWLGDTVDIVHVIDPTIMLGPDPGWSHELEGALRDAGTKELAKVADRVRAGQVTVETRLLAGRPGTAILAEARGNDVRLVVMGTHGRKGLARLFLGSVTEEVAAQAPCPVLATHGAAATAGLAGSRRLQVMVATEASPAADAAVSWVKALRKAVPCDVTFFQPYWPPAEVRRYGVEPAGPEGLPSSELLELLERELRRSIGALPGEGEVRVAFRVFDGHGARMLAAEAERLEPDLVVMGVGGRGSRGRFEVFPPAAALRACRAPVICVPESLRERASGRVPTVRTVLVCTDLSDFANQGVPAAYGLLRGTGGHVVICHAYPRDPHADLGATGLSTLPRLTSSTRYGTEEMLKRLVPPEAAALGITTEVAVVESASVPEALVQEAERIDADVLVLASHGRTGPERAVMGSVAQAVVRTSRRPVMVLHPPQL